MLQVPLQPTAILLLLGISHPIVLTRISDQILDLEHLSVLATRPEVRLESLLLLECIGTFRCGPICCSWVLVATWRAGLGTLSGDASGGWGVRNGAD